MQTSGEIRPGAIVDLSEAIRAKAKLRKLKEEKREFHFDHARRVLANAFEIADRHIRAGERIDEELAAEPKPDTPKRRGRKPKKDQENGKDAA